MFVIASQYCLGANRMYICICKAVTDSQIRHAVSTGARTMRDLRQQLGVCSACGKCGKCASEILHGALVGAKSYPLSSLNMAVA